MKKVYSVFLALLLFASTQAQLTGTKSIPGDYADLTAAIADLNLVGVGAGGVTLNVTTAQTAPLGGYVIGGTGSLILSGAAASSAANPISIIGNLNTATAFAVQTAGSLNDAVFKLVGADYVTIQGFLMQEAAANTITAAATNNMTEFGVALLYVTTTNGAQNNTIQNNAISLNRTYQNSFGIYANSTHSATTVTTSATATTAAGGNSGLKIYGNSISNVNNGIVIIGPTAAADHNIGVEVGGTVGNANNITNYGTTGTFSAYANVSGTVNGILLRNSNGFTASFNTITSSAGGVTVGTLNGIQVAASSAAPTGTFTNNINNNTISLQSGLIAGAINGITYPSGSASATSVLNVNNNNFIQLNHSVAGTGAIIGLVIASTNLTLTVSNNTFTNLTANTTGSFTFIQTSYSMSATGTKTITNNSIVTAFNKTGAGGTVTFYNDQGLSSPNGSVKTVTGNIASNITVTGATNVVGFGDGDGSSATSAPTKTITGNTVSNIIAATGQVTGMSVNYCGPNSTLSSNTISNISSGGIILGIAYGGSNGQGTHTISSNTINNLASTGGAINGIQTAAASVVTLNVNNNTISRLSTTFTSQINGIIISAGTTVNIFKNNVNDVQSDNASGTVNGIVVTAGTTNNLYNNFISDLRTPSANAAVPLYGINIAGGTNAGVYYNTVALGKAATVTSTGAQFGVTGIGYSSSTNTTLRNNIVWIDATPVGTGAVAAVRRSAAGVAGTAPSATNFNSNNNIYHVLIATGTSPVVANLNKYLYLEGNVTTTATNGYGIEIGQVDNVTLNLKNDANFNTACGLYKTFMGSRETATFTEDNLTAGAGNTFVPVGSSFAAENAQTITIPSITDDYSSAARSATADIGALEFTGIGVDAAAPSITFTALTNTVCTSAPTLAAVITDASGVNTTPGLAPRMYYRKGGATAEADVFLNYPTENTNAFNGWKYVEATGTAPNFSFAVDYSLLQSPMVLGDSLTYFVVAQDLAATPNVGKNSVTFPTSFCPTSVVIPATGAVPTSASLGFKIIPYLPTYTNSTAGNYQQGTVNAQKMYINVTGFNPCLDNVNSVTFNTGTSTAPATDITQAKCYYTTTSTFATTTPYGTPIATPSGAMTFTGTQALAAGTGNYFWLVYDVSCTAVVLDSINATATNIVIGSTPFVPTGTNYSRHAVSALYAPTYTNTTAGNYQQGTTNATKVYINISGSAACMNPVNSVTFNTGTSTAPALDITQAKCYYTTTSTFATTTPYGAPIATPSGAMTFTGSQTLASGSGNYFWLVYDVNCAATVADSINATVTNIVVGSTTFVPTGTPYSKHAVSAPVVGDNIVTAPTAALGLAAVNPYITLGKTLESGEPSPIQNAQGGGGNGQANYSWGSAAGSTTWYKLVVPTSGYGSSGNLGIWADTSVGSNADNQIAIWEFPSMPSGCGNTANFTGAKLLQANDDRIVTAGTDFIATGELIGSGLNAAIRTRLTPGSTYYIQIDGFGTNTPFGNLYIEDLSQAPYSMANNGLGEYHNPTGVDMRYAAYEVNGSDGWTYYYENNGTTGTVTDDKVLMAVNWGAGFLYNGTYAPGTTMANHLKGSARNVAAPSTGNTLIGSDSIVVWSGRNNAAAASNDLALTDGGYVLSPNWWMMNKFWNLIPRNQPSSMVGVRTFYSDADFTALQAAVVAGGGVLASPSAMQMMKATKSATTHYSNSEVDPGGGHAALTLGSVTTPSWVNTAGVQTGINQSEFNISAFSGGGGGSTGTPVSVLPIRIDYITGRKNGSVNNLDWKVTCTNSPTVELTLERSGNGSDFKAINIQNETQARCDQPFAYTDANPLQGKNYYRVKVVGVDGIATYSRVVTLLNADKGFELISITPNPVNDASKLNIASAKADRVTVTIVDKNGRIAYTSQVVLVAGSNTIPLASARLASGSYHVIVTNQDGERKNLSFVK
jgi:hypothetical protein